MYYEALFLFALVNLGQLYAQEGKRVQTEVGTIIGITKTVTAKGQSVNVDAFLGIPYAKPPTGDLRFSKPEPKEKFSSLYEAFQYGASCPQPTVESFPAPDVMSEDCLFLNVFVPSAQSEEPSGRAVMVWIHGGGLAMGNSDVYGGSSFVASGDVILVSINYRLNIFGFFSTGDQNVPGNMGFWDQRLALQWVQANIEAFGGDKSRVTIFGESAGGVSVSMQALYPKNQGLFHRIIPESGAATTMPISEPDEAKESAVYLGELFNCTTENSEKLVSCLRKLDLSTIMAVFQDLSSKPDPTSKAKLHTIVDGDFVKINPKHLTREAKNGQVDEVEFYRAIDNLSGFNNREGSLLATFMMINGDPEEYKPTRNEMMDSLLPVLGYTGRMYPDVINDMIKSMYTNWENPDDTLNVRDEVIKVAGDIMFDVPAIEFARLHANTTSDVNSYLYYFTPKPTWSLVPTPSWVDGANHADELGFVFVFDEELMKIPNDTVILKDWENNLSVRMNTYWTNFGKTGNPNKPTPVDVEWPKFKMDTQKHMEFRKDTDVVGQYLNARRADFWLNTIPAVKEAIEHAHDASSPFVKSKESSCDANGSCDGE